MASELIFCNLFKTRDKVQKFDFFFFSVTPPENSVMTAVILEGQV